MVREGNKEGEGEEEGRKEGRKKKKKERKKRNAIFNTLDIFKQQPLAKVQKDNQKRNRQANIFESNYKFGIILFSLIFNLSSSYHISDTQQLMYFWAGVSLNIHSFII